MVEVGGRILDTSALMERAMSAEEASLFEEAEECYSQTYQGGEQWGAFMLAQLLESQGKRERAARWYEHSLGILGVLTRAARNLRALGRAEEANELIRQHAERDPEAAVDFVGSDVLPLPDQFALLSGFWVERAANPENFVVSVSLGNVLCALGRNDLGKEIYQEAALNGDAHAAHNLGLELLEEDPQQALKWITKGMELGSKKSKKWLKQNLEQA